MTTPKLERLQLKKHANTYIETYTGKKFDVFNPQPEDISIVDVAHALSMMCRYNGHCKYFFSVAEHSINVCDFVAKTSNNKKLLLWGLLHDATEAYLADITSPVKPYLSNYVELEQKIMGVICGKFGLQVGMPTVIHEADIEMLRAEAYQLMTSKGVNWKANMESDTPIIEMKLKCYSPDEAKLFFLEKFFLLQGK